MSNLDLMYKPQGTKKPFSSMNPYLYENVRIYLNSIDDSVELLKVEKDKHRKNKFTLKCKCGEVFERSQIVIHRNPNAIICPKCYDKQRGVKIASRYIEQRIEVIEKAGYEILSDINSIRTKKRMLLKTKEGYLCSTNYAEISKGNKALIFSGKYNKENLVYNANIFCKNNKLSTKVLEYIEGDFKKPHIKCQCECGNIYETDIYTLTRKENPKIRCNLCAVKTSQWCLAVEEVLNQNNISYQKEVRFDDCKDVFTLPFDYQIENGLIEVDGEHHFTHNNFAKTPIEKEIALQTTKYHDAIKDEYCKANNIPLLRISYKDIKKGLFKDKILQFVGA